MDRKEAIEVLKKNKPTNDPRRCGTELCEAVDMAIEALKEPKRKWIPVSERLPENGCGVLVTVNGKHNNIIFVNELEIAEYRNTEGWIIEGYLDWLDPNVIAWQPLPRPYKESEDCWVTKAKEEER